MHQTQEFVNVLLESVQYTGSCYFAHEHGYCTDPLFGRPVEDAADSLSARIKEVHRLGDEGLITEAQVTTQIEKILDG